MLCFTPKDMAFFNIQNESSEENVTVQLMNKGNLCFTTSNASMVTWWLMGKS